MCGSTPQLHELARGTRRVASGGKRPAYHGSSGAGRASTVGHIGSEHGGLDVLITSAGVLTENRPAEELSLADFAENYEVNVVGTVNSCQAFCPLLKRARGGVMCITSQAALVSLPAQAAYSASKGSVTERRRSASRRAVVP